MPTLIDRNGRRDDVWVRIEGEGDVNAVAPGASVLLPLAEWRRAGSQWLERAGAVGVLLAPSDEPADIAADLDRLALVAVDFPAFTDGRGYSIARLLRERYRYRGELRAVGDVLRVQLFAMARCGFDTFALRDGVDADAALTAFSDFSDAYQAAVDRRALFERRSGAAQQAASHAGDVK